MVPWMALGYCRCHSSPTDEETEGRTEAMGLAKAGTTCLVERSSPHGGRGYGAGQGRHRVRGRAQLPARGQRLWGWPRPAPRTWWSAAPRTGTEAMGLAKAGTTCVAERSSPHGHRGYGAGQGRHHMLGGAQLPAWAVSAPELSVVPPRCLSLQKKSDGDADNSD